MSDQEERAAERAGDVAKLARMRHRRGACPWCGGEPGAPTDVRDLGPGWRTRAPETVACCCMPCFAKHHAEHQVPDHQVACIGCPGRQT